MRLGVLALVFGSLVVRPDPVPKPVTDPACQLPSDYTPHPAASAAAQQLPLPATKLALEPIKSGDAFTVWGAAYYLRSRRHHAEVTKSALQITGFIVKTNLGEAPKCAVHRGGQADPDNCRSPIPTFWLGDRPDAAVADCIPVMGFASNYAQLYDAIKAFDGGKPDSEYFDTFWGLPIPNPLPMRGAKVTVHGTYATSFTKASSGSVVDPVMGIFSFERMQTLEPASELATLPGVKRKPR